MESSDRAPLLYLAGEDRAGDLAAAGLPVHTAVVYRALKADHFPPPVAAALAQGELDGVLHFSARSAEAYLDCAAHDAIRESALAPVHYCLSRQVAAPLSAAGAVGDADRGPPRRGGAAGACGIGMRLQALPLTVVQLAAYRRCGSGNPSSSRKLLARVRTRGSSPIGAKVGACPGRCAARAGGEWCAADPGSLRTPPSRRSRNSGAPLRFARAAPHPGHEMCLS